MPEGIAMILYNPHSATNFAPTCQLRPLPAISQFASPSYRRLSHPEAEQSFQECYELGMQHLAQRQYGSALLAFNQAIALNPDRAEVWYGRGDALANQTCYSQALDSFDCALAIDPNRCEVWTFRGVVLLHLQRDADALHSCDRALALCPQDAEA